MTFLNKQDFSIKIVSTFLAPDLEFTKKKDSVALTLSFNYDNICEPIAHFRSLVKLSVSEISPFLKCIEF